MKHNHNHDNAPDAGPQLVPVRFEFTHPSAVMVAVAGTFNDWQCDAKTLHPIGGGHWLKESALPPGTYEYRFIVDGEWMADPRAPEVVANPFGGHNSILKVGDSSAAALRGTADSSPLKRTSKPKTKKL